MRQFLDMNWTFLPASVLLTATLGMGIPLVPGLPGMRRILKEKPAAVLRNE